MQPLAFILFLTLISSGLCDSPLKLKISTENIYSRSTTTWDFPNPSLTKDGPTWWAYSTNAFNFQVPYVTTQDISVGWAAAGDALPTVPSFIQTGSIWAPSVVKIADGNWVMFFSSKSTVAQAHCVFKATANNPQGPFTVVDHATFKVCNDAAGGVIDPSFFRDSDSAGTSYLVYKIDGNNLGGGGKCGNEDNTHPTPIMLQKLTSDLNVDSGSAATQLLDRDQSLDGPLVDSPFLWKEGSTFVLGFSSNCYNTDLYDISYATATALTGPFTKALHPDGPLLKSDQISGIKAPGGASFYRDSSALNIAFSAGSAEGHDRKMYVGTVQVTAATSSKRQVNFFN